MISQNMKTKIIRFIIVDIVSVSFAQTENLMRLSIHDKGAVIIYNTK